MPVDTEALTDEMLLEYDDMMRECSQSAVKHSRLATDIWSDVLRELELRGRIRLVSGSYDDIGNSLVERYAPPSSE